MNPVIAVMMTAKVDTSVEEILIILGSITMISIFETMVSAVGNDFLSTLTIILPLIRSLFGSSARTKDGIPMVTTLVRVS